MGYAALFVRFFVIAVWLLMLGRVLISWIDPHGVTTAGRLLFSATEPILGPIRRALPSTGSLDISPLIVFLVLAVLLKVVI